MENEQPYDPFEFAEDSIDKTFREGFVMDTGMDAGNASTPAQPRIGAIPVRVPIEIVKEKPKKKMDIKKKVKKAIKKKLEELS